MVETVSDFIFGGSKITADGDCIEKLTHLKRPWERLRAEEKGTTEDEMIGWHHWLNGNEFE